MKQTEVIQSLIPLRVNPGPHSLTDSGRHVISLRETDVFLPSEDTTPFTIVLLIESHKRLLFVLPFGLVNIPFYTFFNSPKSLKDPYLLGRRFTLLPETVESFRCLILLKS